MLRRPWILLLLVLLSVQAGAELKPFRADTINEIEARSQGQPFLLALWSLDCPPCFKELDMLSRWIKKYPGQNVVLISADDSSLADQAWQVIQKYNMEKVDGWIFSDDFSERIRYNIDPSWHGELPRSYFYSADHTRQAHSGTLSEQMLIRWVAQE